MPAPRGAASSAPQAELAVLDMLRSARGRGKAGLSGEAVQQLNMAVSVLEADGGVEGAARPRAGRPAVCVQPAFCSPRYLRHQQQRAQQQRKKFSSVPPSPLAPPPRCAAPTTLPSISGKWRLLYTSRPGSASPIQRTFTGVEAFSIFQQIDLASEQPRVNNIVSQRRRARARGRAPAHERGVGADGAHRAGLRGSLLPLARATPKRSSLGSASATS